MNIEFNSVKDLYERLTPALNAREYELKRSGYSFIKKEDIWNYLIGYKWKGTNNLLLFQMVDDILNIDCILLRNYVEDNFKNIRVEPKFESEGF